MSERSYSYSDEEWQNFGSIDEAMDYILECTLEENEDFEVGMIIQTGFTCEVDPVDYMPDAEDVLELYDTRICGHHNSDYAYDGTGYDCVDEEAQKELTDYLKIWAKKNIKVSFQEVKNDEEVEITQEMIDAFHAKQPIPMPEFKYGAPENE